MLFLLHVLLHACRLLLLFIRWLEVILRLIDDIASVKNVQIVAHAIFIGDLLELGWRREYFQTLLQLAVLLLELADRLWCSC